MNADIDALTAELDSLVPPPQPLTRRGFLVTALGAGFALAVQPVMAQTAISTEFTQVLGLPSQPALSE